MEEGFCEHLYMQLDLTCLFLRSLSMEPLESDLGLIDFLLSDLGVVWCGGRVW